MTRDWAAVIQEHQGVIAQLVDQTDALDGIVAAITQCLQRGRRVYTFGNGGSAADAQHIAGELLGRFKCERVALPALAIAADVATLTAIGNDLGYECIFTRQLEGLLESGDIAWAISTSGNSANVVNAARLARDVGGTVIGFTGATGGELAPLCHHAFKAPHTSSDRIQEAHQLAYHYICERVEANVAGAQHGHGG